MTEPLAKPPKKDPVARTRQPTLPPGLRSRAGLGLTAMAAEGRFALQVCAECGAVQYPPRDVCGTCLSGELPWRDVSPAGHLMVSTTLHHSNDVYFRERLPWRVGTVQMQAGPSVIAHIHADCSDNSPVNLALRLDRSGQAVMIALPARSTPNMTDEKTLRETSCDPKFRRVLVTDGKSAIGQAVARAMLDAGSPTVFLGDPQVWRHDAAFAKLAEDPRVQTVPLDVTDTDAVERAAAAIGGKVEILVNTADFEREGGLLGRKDVNIARDALDVNALGLVRLAQAFGGALCGRAADGVNNAAAWVNVLSVYAHMNLPSHGLWSAAKAAALSLAQCLRAEMAGAGVRVVNVFPGPVDHEWQQRTPPPRVSPAAIATAIVKALQQGVEDVYVGDIAQEVRARLAENPKGLERELAAPAR